MLIAELGAVLRRDKFRSYVTLDQVEASVELIRRESTSMPDPALADVPLNPHLTRLRSRIPVKSPREFLDLLE